MSIKHVRGIHGVPHNNQSMPPQPPEYTEQALHILQRPPNPPTPRNNSSAYLDHHPRRVTYLLQGTTNQKIPNL